MFSWNVRKDGDEDLNSDDEALVLLGDDAAETAENVATMKRCLDIAANFQGASTLLAQKASHNIEKAKQKQKKGFDARHQNKGVQLSNGIIIHNATDSKS